MLRGYKFGAQPPYSLFSQSYLNTRNEKLIVLLRLRLVNMTKVPRQVALFFIDLGTDVTFKSLDVTYAMNRWEVSLQIAFIHKLPAANLALVTSFSSGSLSVRRVVVNADCWLVTERHVADLTLDTRRPCLHNTAETNTSYTATSDKRFFMFNTHLCKRSNYDKVVDHYVPNNIMQCMLLLEPVSKTVRHTCKAF